MIAVPPRASNKLLALKKSRALKIIAIIYCAYLVLIGAVAIPAINLLAPKIYQQQTGRILQLGKLITINPFTLTLSVREASSASADGSPLWSLACIARQSFAGEYLATACSARRTSTHRA